MAIETIVNLKTTSYRVRVRDHTGSWLPARTCKTKKEAIALERQLKRERFIPTSERQGKRVLGRIFKEYWADWQKMCRNEVSKGWRQSQDQMAFKYVLPEIGSLKLQDIGPLEISALLCNMEEGFNLAPQTRLHVYNLLNKVFDDAIHYFDLIKQNPVRKRDKPRLVKVERNYLALDQSKRLLKGSRNSPMGIAIWLGLLAGLRVSEIQALSWDCINWHENCILVRKAFKRKIGDVEGYPKSRRWNKIPIPTVLREMLEERFPDSGELVASGSDKILCYNSFRRGLAKICMELGLPRVTPHELRHSCTELYIEAGANLEDIRRLLGHASVSSVYTYIHRSSNRLSRLAADVAQECTGYVPDSAKRGPSAGA